MRVLLFVGVLFIIVFSTTNAQTTYYSQSFETSNPFQYWTSNGSYTINYFGLSSEKAAEGSKSLKMDITVNGSGDKECYYYWKIPVKINLHGTLDFSSYLWMDSETAKYVKLGYQYAFPPTTITRTPAIKSIPVYSSWYKQTVSLSDDVIYHADYFAHNKIYGSTYDDFGRELNFIQLIIKAKGSHRFVFYIDKIELKGSVLNQAQFPDYYNSWWAVFQNRLNATKLQKHDEYNNLPPKPSTANKTLTTKAVEYVNNLNNAQTSFTNLFSVIDNNQYFEPKYMDSLNMLLGLYPSWVTLLQNELNNPSAKLDVYSMNPTEWNRLTGTNIPQNIVINPKLKARVCAGEYEPFSLFLQARTQVNNIKVNWTSLTGSGTIPSSAIDVHIAKVWYQKGTPLTGYEPKHLTQELLIKNDALIKVDESTQTNHLLVERTDGSKYYQNISLSNSAVPKTVKIKDSDVLLPFSLSENRNKQLWITLHIPENTSAGFYTGSITISADVIGTISVIPIEVEVLPFKLDESKLSYAIYYHGFVNDWSWENDPFTSFGKSSSQLLIELKDMKEHGVLYPTIFQNLSNLHLDLNLRNQAGLPKDRLFATGLCTSNPTGTTALNNLKNEVIAWKNKMAQYGYSNLYAYGIDEATGDWLVSQRPAWNAVHEAGAKVFASGYYKHYDLVGDILDLGVIQPDPRKEQADLYHSRGHQIYNYHNPMVGVEDPEIYRRNYGFVLWKSGYDGAMDYAYQRGFREIWNDFDIEPNQPHPYRDHCFTYPISDGILSTIQWEGFREGVDDVRYLSTLINKLSSLKSKGADVSSHEQFINSIDPSQDLDQIRNDIINRILSLDGLPPTSTSPFSLISAVVETANTIKLTFSNQLYSGIYTTGNYIIDGITVSKVVLTDKNVITLTTSSHIADKLYTITVRNLKDINKNVIGSPGNSMQYKYTSGSSFSLISAVPENQNTIKLTFSNQIYSGIYTTGNYVIDNEISVSKAVLTDKNIITLTTSTHLPDKVYTITVKNLKDINKEVISSGSGTLQYKYIGSGSATGFSIVDAAVVSSNSIKLTFSNTIYSGIYTTANYSITNGITVTKAELIAKDQVLLTTSNHLPDKTYYVSVKNLKDIAQNIISYPGNTEMYYYTDKVMLKVESGLVSDGASLSAKIGSLGSQVIYSNNTSGSVEFSINLNESNTYYAWGRFYLEGTTTAANSFDIAVDGGSKQPFGNNSELSNKWLWNGNSTSETGSAVKLNLGTLNAGEHNLTITGIETSSPVLLDMVLITSDPAFVPNDVFIKTFQKNTISEIAGIEIPEQYDLAQNYPNPFNPATKIRYALPEASNVTLKIYDILGKEVAVLVNEKKEAGYYEIEFNASALSSGIYIYRLSAENFALSKKMIMVK